MSDQHTISGFTLSPIQRDQWLKNHGRAVVSAVLEIDGTLAVSRLQRAWDRLCAQWPILRSRFSRLQGMDIPLMSADGPKPLLSEEPGEGHLNCEQGPLFHAWLEKGTQRGYNLHVSASRLVADSTTLVLLLKALAKAYADDAIPEPPAYGAVAQWMNEIATGEDAEEGRAHWQRIAPQLPVAIGLSRIPSQAHNQWQSLGWQSNIHWSKLLQLAEAWDLEPAAIGLTLWAAILADDSASDHLLLDIRMDARADEDLAEIPGPLTQWLPAVIDSEPSLSLRDACERAEDVFAEAYEWLEHYSSSSPRTRVPAFAWFEDDPTATISNAWAIKSLAQTRHSSEHYLQLSLYPQNGRCVALIDFDVTQLDPQAAEWLLDRFKTALHGILANPGTHLCDLPKFSREEKQAVITAGSSAAQVEIDQRSIADWFRNTAAQEESQVAVAIGNQSLSYADLNAASDRLAAVLQSLGARPETFVALSATPSLELVVGMMAIFKSGAAHVPLDPTYPKRRLVHSFQTSGAEILLTQSILQDQLPMDGHTVVLLDKPETWPPTDGTPRSWQMPTEVAAYMIFTSGSTGEPKGVIVSMAALLNQCQAIITRHRLRRDDRFLLFAAINFDASLEQILPILLVGGTTVLTHREHWDKTNAANHIQEMELTILNLPTAFWNTLVKHWVSDTCESILNSPLRLVIAGGETMPAETLRAWLQSPLATIEMVNAYGPTEACITATMYQAHLEDAAEQGFPPIGKPLANRRLAIVDKHGHPRPFGSGGEIWLSGAGLARGYCKNAKATARVFRPSADGNQVGARCYHTGDRGRLMPSGHVFFIGRQDDQIKLRGYRIELGEVESALTAHPAVAEAAVSLFSQDGAPENGRLAAYLTAISGRTIHIDNLREFLSQRLPEYMVPTVFATLEALPLTPAGKVDRSALPNPAELRHQTQTPYVPPRNQTETLLVNIWQDILRLPHLGIQDNFFHHGGHSLLAAQVVARIRAAFHVEFPLKQLFPNPTVAAVGELVDQLRREGAHLSQPPLSPQARGQHIPASFAQQRLWLIHDLAPDSSVYHVPVLLEIDGPLQPVNMDAAFAEIIRRHEALRTTFDFHDGEPIQIIHKADSFQLSVIEMVHTEPEQFMDHIHNLASELFTTPFDLRRGPLIKIILVKLNETRHILLVNMHHIIADGWSIKLLMSEFTALYEALDGNQNNPLPPLPIQYADFALWQRSWLQGQALKHQLAYWRTIFKTAPKPLDLPTKGARPAKENHAGALLRFEISPQITRAIHERSRQEGVTLFMTLMAAYQTLLFRYSGQTDITVGIPIAGRTHRETEPLIGMFVNTLPLRSQLKANMAFRELLHQCRQQSLDAFAHSDLPFEKLINELNIPRDTSRSPVFQTLFTLENTPVRDTSVANFSVRPLRNDAHVRAKFELSLFLQETEGGIGGIFEYKTDLFDAHLIESMVTAFTHILTAVGATSDTVIARLPLLDDGQKQWLLAKATQPANYPDEMTLHGLFENQVARRPKQPALHFNHQSYTYDQLNRHANQMARHLITLGVQPETLVAICLPRTLDLPMAIIAVLKTGAAYLCLDPENPRERRQAILADSAATHLITLTLHNTDLPNNLTAILIDEPIRPFDQCSTENLNIPQDPASLAYCIYTSGSTGRPKGVLVEHRQVVRLVVNDQFQFDLPEQAVWSLFHNTNFDVSVFELFGALSHGGTVVIVPRDITLEPQGFLSLLIEQRVTVLSQTPSAFQPLMQEIMRQQCAIPDLAYVIFAGEALEPMLLAAFHRAHPHVQLINMYGITETTVHASFKRIGLTEIRNGHANVGGPIPTNALHILDPKLQLQPVGVVGEIGVGGAGVTRGYLKQPGLTAARFVPDPFGDGTRLYRSGDLAKRRQDGDILYQGRLDDQVQIRGFRVELGEIQQRLVQHPAISEAVLTADQNKGTITAYVVARQLDQNQLRHFLSESLPAYMLPAHVVTMDKLPLTPNGKVNRQALPVVEPTGDEDTYVAPRNPTERDLVTIWADVLDQSQVGVHDNFFELGGHSLSGAALIGKAKEIFGLDLWLRDLFNHPTIEKMAHHIHTLQVAAADEGAASSMLDELTALSPEQIQALLAEERSRQSGGS